MIRWRRVEVSGGFLLTAAALFWLESGGLLFWAALACALHEAGHVIAIRAMGGKIRALRLSVAGAELVFSSGHGLSYLQEIFAAVSGPAVNLALALVCARLIPESAGEGLYLFTGLNLALGGFQLLPVLPLDGGRALLALLEMLWQPAIAGRILEIFSLVCEGLLLGLGVMVFLRTGTNFTMLLIAFWLLAGTLRGGYFSLSSSNSRRSF
ncbi:hypothetical protein SDC9_67646 [bioreactor metagenome]|uniref:Peptidase M50 domain-containing protein n=1 Tax=bioreactor metagenome TaxID=1076179 RepID=A0A644Y3T9_9ZZZZ